MPEDAIVVDVGVGAYNSAQATGRVLERVPNKVNAGVGSRFMSCGTCFWNWVWSGDIVGIVLEKSFKVV
jgi:hypothetical protein